MRDFTKQYFTLKEPKNDHLLVYLRGVFDLSNLVIWQQLKQRKAQYCVVSVNTLATKEDHNYIVKTVFVSFS